MNNYKNHCRKKKVMKNKKFPHNNNNKPKQKPKKNKNNDMLRLEQFQNKTKINKYSYPILQKF